MHFLELIAPHLIAAAALAYLVWKLRQRRRKSTPCATCAALLPGTPISRSASPLKSSTNTTAPRTTAIPGNADLPIGAPAPSPNAQSKP